MSLDVYLRARRTVDIFNANITHNLTLMAAAAGIYLALWHPEDLRVKKAKDLIEPLKKGLEKLVAEPQFYKKYNPPNGYGNYDDFVEFVREYLRVCEENPNAKVSVWR